MYKTNNDIINLLNIYRLKILNYILLNPISRYLKIIIFMNTYPYISIILFLLSKPPFKNLKNKYKFYLKILGLLNII